MPKLDKKKAQGVSEVEPTDFAPIPEGIYTAKLLDVRVSEKPGPSGSHYWIWEFGEIYGRNELQEPVVSGKQWVNVSLGESSNWKMKEVFDAFGVDPDTDTDELIGEEVVLVISQRIIEKGARQGQIGNNVDQVLRSDFDQVEADEAG